MKCKDNQHAQNTNLQLRFVFWKLLLQVVSEPPEVSYSNFVLKFQVQPNISDFSHESTNNKYKWFLLSCFRS